MKNIKIGLALMAVLMVVAFIGDRQVSAASFRETPAEDMKVSSRTVFFHDGAGSQRIAVGMCRTGILQLATESGNEIMNFLQPCGFGSMLVDGSEDVTLQAGIGLVEVMKTFSFNVAFDSRKGNIFWGSGISLEFDDSFRFLK